MKTTNERLIEWAINKIEMEYQNEICLLISHSNLRLDGDVDGAVLSYFVPATEHGYGLAKTFMINGIGYDLYPRSWERLERLAELNDGNLSCLGDVEILYYRNEEDKQRFLDLQAKLRENLLNTQYVFHKSLEKLNIAMEIYQTMIFEENFYKVRKASGYIVDFLSSAVAFANMTYFKNGINHQISELLAFESIPDNFVNLYKAIAKADSILEIRELCYKMIFNTRQFLSAKKNKSVNETHNINYQDLANWYQELSYTWRRVYHYCDENDAVRGFMWGCFLQYELDVAKEEFGLSELDLLSSFHADNLSEFRKRAEALETQIISIIEDHGVKLDAYASVEDFIRKNS